MTMRLASDEAKSLAEQLKLYGQYQRLQILSLLLEGPQAVSHIEAATGIGQPTLSQHLGALRRAGAIESQRNARSTVYRVANEQERHRIRLMLAVLDPERLASQPLPALSDGASWATAAPGRSGEDVGAQFARLRRSPTLK